MNSTRTSVLNHVVDHVDDFIDARWRWLRKRLGWSGVPAIQPYVGYATDDRVWFHGRVLTNIVTDTPSLDDGWLENLSAMYQRMESDEVVGATVEIDFAGKKYEVVTDEEGYFHLESQNSPDIRGKSPWKSITMRIINHENVTAEDSMVVSRMLTPPKSAKVGLISDIDDTIVHTGATSLLKTLQTTFFHNARSRKPLAGAAALYRAISKGSVFEKGRGESNPVFYVSSSPWNLHDMLEDFLQLNNLPDGPILLRDLGFDQNKFLAEGHGHKLTKAKTILKTYPELPFVVFGDSGQEDALIYSELAKSNPDQVAAIFIRDVDPMAATSLDDKVSEAIESVRDLNIPFHLVGNSVEAAGILNEMGLVHSDAIPIIQEDVERDLKAKV